MKPDKDRIRRKVQFVRDTLRQLEEIGSRDEMELLADPILQAAAIRNLQVGIEAILDAANHIIAREGLGLPRTYAESVDLLVRHDILPRDRAADFARMVRFRNRAVHLYEDIDAAEVVRILREDLGDFEAFVRAMVDRYLS